MIRKIHNNFLLLTFLVLSAIPLGFGSEIGLRPNLSLYYYAETMFFNPKDTRRFGIEIEFENLLPKETALLIQKHFGGQINEITKIINIAEKENYDGPEEGRYITKAITNYVVKGTPIGDVKVVHEFNEQGAIVDLANVNIATEVVTSKIRVEHLETFQKMTDLFRANGATGTTENSPLGIHVTIEINDGEITEQTGAELVDYLRNLLRKTHWEENQYYMNIPENRRAYMRPYSPGFRKKLEDPKYRPTTSELYDDFIYRQTLEMMNLSDSSQAWKLPINKVKEIVLAQKEKLIPMVAKFQPMKITSVLIHYRPEDFMSKLFYTMLEWITPTPAIEFRESNTDFQVARAAKRFLGFTWATLEFGVFDIDTLVSEITTVGKKTLKQIRKKLKAQPDEPIIFRYMIANRDLKNDPDWSEVFDYYTGKDIVVGYLPEEQHGIKPLIIPGESVVFHRRPHHRFSVMGKYNPALINFSIAQMLEHKYIEYRFWEKYAPGAMQGSALLSHAIDSRVSIPRQVEKLNQQFPNGWVLKGAFDLATEKQIVTNDLDVVKEIQDYLGSDFNEYYNHLKLLNYGEDLEDIIIMAREHPNYMGWKLFQFFTKPHTCLVQSRVKIVKEMRVEVIAGKVLGRGTTVDRYAYLGENQRKAFGKKTKATAVDIKGAEDYAQAIINKLPEKLRNTPFAMDVAILSDGSFTLIESNAGGNSGFLATTDTGVNVLNDFLREIPERVRSGQLNLGMKKQEQITYLKNQMKEWDINIDEIPTLDFDKNSIVDEEITPVQIPQRGKWRKCDKILDSLFKVTKRRK